MRQTTIQAGHKRHGRANWTYGALALLLLPLSRSAAPAQPPALLPTLPPAAAANTMPPGAPLPALTGPVAPGGCASCNGCSSCGESECCGATPMYPWDIYLRSGVNIVIGNSDIANSIK